MKQKQWKRLSNPNSIHRSVQKEQVRVGVAFHAEVGSGDTAFIKDDNSRRADGKIVDAIRGENQDVRTTGIYPRVQVASKRIAGGPNRPQRHSRLCGGCSDK